jgi:hypothetical protein
VHDAGLMGRPQALGQLNSEVELFINRKPSPPQAPHKALPANQLGCEVDGAVFTLAGLIDGRDIGVVDGGRRATFAQKPGPNFVVLRQARLDLLERDFPLEKAIAGTVHDTHAAFTEALGYFKSRNTTRHRRRVVD